MSQQDFGGRHSLGVPHRFDTQGRVQRYPGNTTVCHIPKDTPLQLGLNAVRDALNGHPILTTLLHTLPPSSWHMTVVDGVREADRRAGQWPPGQEEIELRLCTDLFATRLGSLGPILDSEGLAPPYSMFVTGFHACINGVGLAVQGSTPEEEQRMRRLRDRIADAMGFRKPTHEVYDFHVGIAYLLRYLSHEESQEINRVLADLTPLVRGEIILGSVEFNVFEDMHSYPIQFYLSKN